MCAAPGRRPPIAVVINERLSSSSADFASRGMRSAVAADEVVTTRLIESAIIVFAGPRVCLY